jgi:hypothetical protein
MWSSGAAGAVGFVRGERPKTTTREKKRKNSNQLSEKTEPSEGVKAPAYAPRAQGRRRAALEISPVIHRKVACSWLSHREGCPPLAVG